MVNPGLTLIRPRLCLVTEATINEPLSFFAVSFNLRHYNAGWALGSLPQLPRKRYLLHSLDGSFVEARRRLLVGTYQLKSCV